MRRKCWPAVVASSRVRGRLTSVQQETKAELMINLKTAKALGVEVPRRCSPCRQGDRINHCNPCTSFAAVLQSPAIQNDLAGKGAGEVRRYPEGMPPGRMSRPCEASATTQDPEGGPILESIVHFHAVAVCQIFETATRIVKWPGVKGNLRIDLPLKQNAGQH